MKEFLASLLLRCLAATWRLDSSQLPPPQAGVLAFWHEEMLPFWKAYASQQSCAVTSLSKDGDILARLLHDWNYTVLRGSSSKGSKELLASMVEHASRQMVLITPDGPRGPAKVFKAGAVICAQRAEVPLFVCHAQISSLYCFKKSWDQFKLPLPFARIVLRVDRQIRVKTETKAEQIEALLAELSESRS